VPEEIEKFAHQPGLLLLAGTFEGFGLFLAHSADQN
jgi:hypothetical protein